MSLLSQLRDFVDGVVNASDEGEDENGDVFDKRASILNDFLPSDFVILGCLKLGEMFKKKYYLQLVKVQ